MVRLTSLLVLIVIAIRTFAMTPDNFSSIGEIEQWLESNKSQIKPIEGIYSMNNRIETNSPYARDFERDITIAIVYDSSIEDYRLYVVDNMTQKVFETSTFVVNKVPNSTSVIFKHFSTPMRLYPSSTGKYSFRMELDRNSTKKAADNPNFIWKIWSTFKLDKQYPL